MGLRGLLRTMGDLLGFWCSGCNEIHLLNIVPDARPCWGFNGNYDKPTFTPSINVTGVRRLTDEEHAKIMRGEKFEPVPRVCHSFVTDGQIQFLGDCTHALKGQTVPLSVPDV